MKMKLFSFITTLIILVPFLSLSQRGKDGSYTVTTTGVNVNTYTTLTLNAAAGATSITVASNALNGANFTGNLAQGDLILIIQMQGASMNIEGTGIYTNPIGYTGDCCWFQNQATLALWGAVTQYNSAGKFEQVEVLGVGGANTITLNCGLQNSYTAAGKVQVIRVPRYVNLTLNNTTSIEPPAWNGSTGGVTAVEVNGNLSIGTGAKITASAKGFRGGSTTVPTAQGGLIGGSGQHTNGNGNGATQIGSEIDDEGGRKGESIGGYNTEYIVMHSPYGRGAPANGGGGGGAQNAGGGGGANVGTGTYTGKGTPSSAYAAAIWNLELAGFASTVSPGGGRGGYSLSTANLDASTQKPNLSTWLGDARKENGGYGGHPLAYDATRLFLGGGGGAGDQDSGQGGSGGTGGGLVMVTCYGTISGSGSIEADGALGQNSNPLNQTASFGQKKGNDGAGGAGGGGSIYIKNMSAIPGTISLLARGGNGGNHALIIGTGASTPSEAAGPGGGGGGGLVSITSGTPTINVNGGNNGVCTAAGGTSGVSEFPANGATNGSSGMTGSSTIYNLIPNNVTICSGNTANPSVTVSGTSPGTLSWYTQQFGGASFATGTSITTPVLSATTTYWVGVCPGTFRVPVVVTVNPSTTSTFNQVAPVCSGVAFSLPATSNEGFTGNWSPAINTSATTLYTFTPTAGQCASTATMTVTVNPSTTPNFTQVSPICAGGSFTLPTTSNNLINGLWSPAINTASTTEYTFNPTAGQCASVVTMTVTVNPIVTPTFTQVAPICSGGSFTLPTTSNNGINGAWSPSINNTATTLYTFTSAAGQCANNATMTVSVGAPVTPTFNAITPVCEGGTITLPASSIEGFTGTWSPAVDNTQTTLYTFIPTAGQCANNGSLTVNVTPLVDPTFNQVGPICEGSPLSLPSSSIENITGTWSPAPNNMATTPYTFVPDAGQCANNGSITVTVNTSTTPTFTQIAPICSGGTINLPASSLEGITGSWSPAVNNTQTTTYTFTPAAGQCASTATMTVSVGAPVTPTFDPWGPYCQNDIIIQVILPETSNEGITGTWNPAMVSTAVAGNIVHTFTPDAGQCATSTTMTVVVNPQVTTTFTQIAPICVGDALSLPGSSLEGIPGTWSPAPNNATTTTYNFVPNAGQCATEATMTVNVGPPATPTFDQVGPVCTGQAFTLPTTSLEGFTGTWSPAINTSSTTNYTFTPSAGQCAVNGAMTVTVTSPFTPTFNQVAPVCSGGVINLPVSSIEGVTGTWSPALNNTATTNYTFTPDAGQCSNTAAMTVTVNPNPSVDLTGLTVVNEHCGQADGSIAGVIANGGTPGYTYEWNNSATLNTADISGLTTGSYNLEVTDSEGCTATASVNVGADAAPVIDGSAVQSVDPTCLSGGSITGLTVSAGSSYTVAWGGSTGTTLDLNGLAAGTYTVTVTDANGCEDSFGPITLTAPTGATASFTYAPAEPSEGETVIFTNSSDGAGPIVSTWNISGSDSVTTNISEVFDTEGTYDVMLSIVDANGCVDTVVQTVVVFGSLVVPNVITANGDNVNDTFEIKGLKSNTQVTIIDRWGIVVFETDNYNNDWGGKDRSGKDLKDGVYTYIFKAADGKSGHGFVHLIRD